MEEMIKHQEDAVEKAKSKYDSEVAKWIIRGEIHHLSGVWKSIFRFLRNHDSGKKGIAFFLKPYNDVMHFIV